MIATRGNALWEGEAEMVTIELLTAPG